MFSAPCEHIDCSSMFFYSIKVAVLSGMTVAGSSSLNVGLGDPEGHPNMHTQIHRHKQELLQKLDNSLFGGPLKNNQADILALVIVGCSRTSLNRKGVTQHWCKMLFFCKSVTVGNHILRWFCCKLILVEANLTLFNNFLEELFTIPAKSVEGNFDCL